MSTCNRLDLETLWNRRFDPSSRKNSIRACSLVVFKNLFGKLGAYFETFSFHLSKFERISRFTKGSWMGPIVLDPESAHARLAWPTQPRRTSSKVGFLIAWQHSMWMMIQALRKLGGLGPLHTRDWEPTTITLQALSLAGRVEPVQVCFTLRLRVQRTMWKQDGCKVYVDSYVASNGSCFMVTWTILKNHLLEVGLTQNLKTMTLRKLTTINLFYFIMHEDPHE